jgi:hypothetical protein
MIEDDVHVRNIRDLTDVVVERLHYTYVVKDLTTFREEFRYVFSNTHGLQILPLVWRLRGVEANMVITDSAEGRLIYLPSGRVMALTRAILTDLWLQCVVKIPPGGNSPTDATFDIVAGVAEFNPGSTQAKAAQKALSEVTEFDANAPEFKRLSAFVSKLGRNYIPFVWMKSPAEGTFSYLKQGVDTLEVRGAEQSGKGQGRREYRLPELLTFLTTGSIHFDVLVPWAAFDNPPWRQTNSLHFRVLMPEGLEVDNVSEVGEAGILDGTPFIKESKWDGGLFYTYLTPEAAQVALEKRRKLQVDFSLARASLLKSTTVTNRGPNNPYRPIKTLRDFLDLVRKGRLARDADAPSVRIEAAPVPGVRALLSLLWIVVGLAYFYTLTGSLDATSYIGWVSALLIVVLSTVVYGIEKPFSRAPIIAQSIAATAALVELLALYTLIGR